MDEKEYLRARIQLLEALLQKALPILRLAHLYPTLVRNVELAISSSSGSELLSRSGEPSDDQLQTH